MNEFIEMFAHISSDAPAEEALPPGLSKEDVAELKVAFKKYDLDNSGSMCALGKLFRFFFFCPQHVDPLR